MATYSQAYATQVIADDAAFRARGKWISDTLQAAGWTKQADTGQIDWATVTKPTVANTVAGYEIRKSTDALTGIYAKIEYGTGGGATSFCLWLQSGEGTDGAGTLTGDKTTRVQAGALATSAVANSDYISATTSRFGIMVAVIGGAVAGNTSFIGIQRNTDASGVDTSDGWHQWAAGYNQIGSHEYVNFTSGTAGVRNMLGAILSFDAPCPGSAGAIPVFPLYLATNTQFVVMRDIVVIPVAYATGGSTHTFSLLGSNRTYISGWGGQTGGYGENGTPGVNCAACMRWE